MSVSEQMAECGPFRLAVAHVSIESGVRPEPSGDFWAQCRDAPWTYARRPAILRNPP